MANSNNTPNNSAKAVTVRRNLKNDGVAIPTSSPAKSTPNNPEASKKASENKSKRPYNKKKANTQHSLATSAVVAKGDTKSFEWKGITFNITDDVKSVSITKGKISFS